MSRTFIADYLSTYFDEVEPFAFYRAIFPEGELEDEEHRQEGTTGRYNAIAVVLDGDKISRKVIHNNLRAIPELLEGDRFTIVSPLSYVGFSRKGANARFVYAIAIDLDGIESEQNLQALFTQIELEYIPKPTYIVASGSGVHLYYQFEKALPCFKNITKQLFDLKKALTKIIWNRHITTAYKDIQIQGIYQGFRMVGTTTKGGNKVRAFITGDKISVEYLNNFVSDKNKITRFTYKTDLTLAQAKELYPEWYQSRIVEGKKKGTWTNKRDLYDWWLRTITNDAQIGHRYFCIMCLSIYAKKCRIEREELERDAMSLVPLFDKLSTPDNRFTERDVLVALEAYNEEYITFPRKTISEMSAIEIHANKRNGRKRKEHCEIMRFIRDNINNNKEWQNKKGAPTKQAKVVEYFAEHPEANISECARALGVSRNTARKWREKI